MELAVDIYAPSSPSLFPEANLLQQSDRCAVELNTCRIAFLQTQLIECVPEQDSKRVLPISLSPMLASDAYAKAKSAVLLIASPEVDATDQLAGEGLN